MKVELSFLLLAFAFYAQAWNKADYPNSRQLTPDYTLHWRMDFDLDSFSVALEVKTLGWVGFGIGERTSGSMPGADFAIINVNGGVPSLTDRYVREYDTPIPDSCQDWKLIDFVQDTRLGVTVVELSRLLDTGDQQDRPIVPGMNKVLFSFGLTNEVSVTYHEERRGSIEHEFYPDPNAPAEPEYEFTREYRIGDAIGGEFRIPITETNYICTGFAMPFAKGEQYHVVKVEPKIDPRGVLFAHHILVHVCDDAGPLSYVKLFLDNPGRCLSPIGNPTAKCHSLMYGWAQGGGPLYLPPAAGFRVGDHPEAFQYVVMELHYNNPKGTFGVDDNTGFNIFYTSKMRQYDAAQITLGDPMLQMGIIPAGKEAFALESSCPSQCTREWPHDIHVFTSSAHMHSIGSMQWTTHYRDDVLLRTTNRVEYFQFDFQQLTWTDFVVKPGDRLNTHCVYDSRERKVATRMGMGSDYEMCMDFVVYYPKLWDRKDHYSYCGYFTGGTSFCGSMNFVTGVKPYPNPVKPDMAQGINTTFGWACDQ